MFLAHDAGHTEITGNQTKDKLIGGFIASWMMGMSLGKRLSFFINVSH